MKNLKIFIAFIFLAFAIGTTLKAQDQAQDDGEDCFNMEISHTQSNTRSVLTITVDNYGGSDVIVTDNYGNTRTCSSSCSFRWFYYNTPGTPMPNVDIVCVSNQWCSELEGCVIVIEPQ